MQTQKLQSKKFRFRNFPVYKETRETNKEIKNLLNKKLPKDEKFGLKSQTYRALDSILLNIAEGSERGTDRDFAHFLNISQGSLHEVVACLDIAYDDKYISEKELENLVLKNWRDYQINCQYLEDYY